MPKAIVRGVVLIAAVMISIHYRGNAIRNEALKRRNISAEVFVKCKHLLPSLVAQLTSCISARVSPETDRERNGCNGINDCDCEKKSYDIGHDRTRTRECSREPVPADGLID